MGKKLRSIAGEPRYWGLVKLMVLMILMEMLQLIRVEGTDMFTKITKCERT